MVDKAWSLQPDRDWYVFVEANAYLSWPNLLRFLATYNPRQPWYLSSTTPTTKANATAT